MKWAISEFGTFGMARALMRFAHRDVRGHIVLRRNSHRLDPKRT